jgi:hypothetical protein
MALTLRAWYAVAQKLCILMGTIDSKVLEMDDKATSVLHLRRVMLELLTGPHHADIASPCLYRDLK